MTTPPPVRRRPRAKTPPNFGRAKSEYHEKAPPPLPPRDMYSQFSSSTLPPLPPVPDADVPPPVPSTPRPSLPAEARSPTRSIASISQRVYPDESETFTLSQLVAKHSLLFPIKVKVTKGFFGERGEDSIIPVDEMYNVYFVKKAKVVTIRDSTRCKYIVPINSASKFGLIYKSKSFSDTHVFDTVEDLLLASPLPKVVTALVAHQGPDEHTSVHRSEVLVIKGVHKPGRLKTMFRSQQEQIKVFSLKTMQEKMLPKDVFCRFTVDPQYTQLYLPELLKYVDNPIPSSAKLFLDYDSGDPLPDFLVSGVVQLEKVEVETSIITSHVCDPEDEDEHQFSDDDDDGARLTERMVDIPISLDVEVSVLPPQDVSSHGDYEYGKLYEDAMTLVREFDPHNLSRFDGNEDYSYVTQNRFFSAVRKGYEKEGLDIVFPNMRRKTPLSSSSSSDYVGPDALDDYEECNFGPPSASAGGSASLPRMEAVQTGADYYVNSGMTPPTARPHSAKTVPEPLKTFTYDTPPKRGGAYDVPPKSPKRSVTESEGPDAPPPLPPPRTRESLSTRRSSSLQENRLNHSTQETPSPRGASEKALPPRRTIKSTSSVDQPAVSPVQPPVPPVQKPTSPVQKPASPVDASTGDLSSQFGELEKSISGLSARVVKLEGDTQELSALKRDVSGLKPLVQKLQTSCDSVQFEVSSLRKEVEEMRLQMKNLLMAVGGEGAITHPEETVSLEQLNNEEILQLLDSLNLQRYRAMFESKAVDGHTLSLYTEERLFNELMMISRSDRMKLMNVINTKYVRLVPGVDGANYVAFEKAN